MIPVDPDAFAAGEQLTVALLELADLDRRTPCQVDPEPFFADHPAHQAVALEACTWCPLLVPCGRFAEANGERHGVWGGVLRSDRATRKAVA